MAAAIGLSVLFVGDLIVNALLFGVDFSGLPHSTPE